MRDATTEAVEALRLDMQRLTQGLHVMLDRFERQEALLLEILNCVAIEPTAEEDNPLIVTLKELLAAVQQLPEAMTNAVVAGLRHAGIPGAR